MSAELGLAEPGSIMNAMCDWGENRSSETKLFLLVYSKCSFPRCRAIAIRYGSVANHDDTAMLNLKSLNLVINSYLVFCRHLLVGGDVSDDFFGGGISKD